MSPNKARQSFDEIAAEWNERHEKPRPWLKLFLPSLRKKMVVLDAGCGNAGNAVAIAPRVSKVFAVDSSRRMLEFAEKNVEAAGLGKKIVLKRADVASLPFEKNFFDAAFYIAVLHHLYSVESRARAFAEANRVLKRGGIVFVSVWNKFQPRFAGAGKKAFVDWKTEGGERVKRFYYFFEEKELRALAEENGFRAREVFYEKNGERAERDGAHNLCMVLEKIE